jgi:hypothetical protein
VAILMVGRHCDGAGCGQALSSDVAAAVNAAAIAFDPSTGVWSVTVKPPSGPTLQVTRGTLVAGDVRATRVDGTSPAFVPLSVNGARIPLLP